MHLQAEFGFAAHWRYKEGDCEHSSYVLQMVEWAIDGLWHGSVRLWTMSEHSPWAIIQLGHHAHFHLMHLIALSPMHLTATMMVPYSLFWSRMKRSALNFCSLAFHWTFITSIVGCSCPSFYLLGEVVAEILWKFVTSCYVLACGDKFCFCNRCLCRNSLRILRFQIFWTELDVGVLGVHPTGFHWSKSWGRG